MAELKRSPNQTDPNLRLLGQIALATLLWGSTFVATRAEWLAPATSLPGRVALVVVGLGGFLPVVFVYAKAIRMQDEFNMRLHLIALGVAFAVIGTLSYSVDLLHRANFIQQPSSNGLWGVMLVVWWLVIVLIPRLYR